MIFGIIIGLWFLSFLGCIVVGYHGPSAFFLVLLVGGSACASFSDPQWLNGLWQAGAVILIAVIYIVFKTRQAAATKATAAFWSDM